MRVKAAQTKLDKRSKYLQKLHDNIFRIVEEKTGMNKAELIQVTKKTKIYDVRKVVYSILTDYGVKNREIRSFFDNQFNKDAITRGVQNNDRDIKASQRYRLFFLELYNEFEAFVGEPHPIKAKKIK